MQAELLRHSLRRKKVSILFYLPPHRVQHLLIPSHPKAVVLALRLMFPHKAEQAALAVVVDEVELVAQPQQRLLVKVTRVAEVTGQPLIMVVVVVVGQGQVRLVEQERTQQVEMVALGFKGHLTQHRLEAQGREAHLALDIFQAAGVVEPSLEERVEQAASAVEVMVQTVAQREQMEQQTQAGVVALPVAFLMISTEGKAAPALSS